MAASQDTRFFQTEFPAETRTSALKEKTGATRRATTPLGRTTAHATVAPHSTQMATTVMTLMSVPWTWIAVLKCVSTLTVASTVPATLDTPSTQIEGLAEMTMNV